MKIYKGFNKDMTCRGFQYEEGKEYEIDGEVECCENGFHGCEYPLDCFQYYEPSQSVFHEVEQSGKISKSSDSDDTKVASSKIKIGAALSIAGLVNASIEYIKERADETKSNHSRANKKANSATGYRSANSATGYRSANSATGYGSANSATGYGSANISTGKDCTNNSAGQANISVGWGRDNKCKGTIGSYLVLSEWGEWDGKKYPFVGAQMICVDGKKYKSDTFYMLKGGEIVEG